MEKHRDKYKRADDWRRENDIAGKKVKHSGLMEMLVGLVIGLLISGIIEVLQLVLCRGLFEWDDMIHNSFGCAVGVAVMKWILKRRCGSQKWCVR